MTPALTGVARAAMAMTLAAVSIIGCSSNSKSPAAPSRSATSTSTTISNSGNSASTSAPAQPTDYTGLLIRASDINAPEVFTASPPINNPNGQPGAATTFSNQDHSHVIADSILILPDPAAAASALDSRKGSLDGSVHGVSVPIDIGTGGTTVSGPSPDGSQGVTVLLFTEGTAFVELEFDGPSDSLVPPDFVSDVGQRQDAAIKQGLAG